MTGPLPTRGAELLRLNTAPGKSDTFVLDFANEPDDIYDAFKPYYEYTTRGQMSDPQQLNGLAHKLNEWQIYHRAELDAWCEIWFRNRLNPSGGEHKKLNSIIDVVVERYRQLEDEEQQLLFKSQLVSFRNLYQFLSQVIPYQDSDLEKLYTFARYLLTKLPRDRSQAVHVDDDVELKYYRLQKISEGKIDLKVGEAEALYGPTAVGTGGADEEVQLSTLVDKLNERFGTEFTPADQLFFDQVRETAVANEKLRQAASVNTMDNFAPVFEKLLEELLIERMEGNEEIFMRLMNDDVFRGVAAKHLMRTVYRQIMQD